MTIEKENAVTIFRKFIAAMTPRPAFLDESKKLQAQFDSPPDAVKAMVDNSDRFARAAAEIAARKTITVESTVVINLDR